MIGNLLANAIKYTAEGGVLLASRQTPRRPAGGGLGHRHRHRARAPARCVPGVLQGGRPCRHVGRLRPGPGHRGAPVACAGPSGQRAFAPGRGAACSGSRCTTPTSRRRRPGSRARWAERRSTGQAAEPGLRPSTGSALLGPTAARAARVVQRLRAALDAQAAEQAPQVHLDRVLADLRVRSAMSRLLMPLSSIAISWVWRLDSLRWRGATGSSTSLSAIKQAAQRGGEFGRAGRLLDVGVGAGFDAGLFHVGRRRGRIAPRSARSG